MDGSAPSVGWSFGCRPILRAFEWGRSPKQVHRTGPDRKVRKGLLRVTVNDDGNVESSANVDLKCQVQGGSQILWIIPQGTEVKAGDVLVKMNSSAIEELITSQQILYERAVADHVLAVTELAVAEIAVKEYEDGTVVRDQQTAEANVIIAKENLKSSENILRHSERMFRKGYVNRLQLETDQFAVERMNSNSMRCRPPAKFSSNTPNPRCSRNCSASKRRRRRKSWR